MPKLGEKVSQMRAQWDRLSTRERRMVTTLAGVLIGFITLLLGYFVWSGLADISDHNEAARQALKDIAQHREEFLEARRRMTSQEVRVSRTAIQLTAVLEAAANEAGVKIDESTDRPPAPRGKKYVEKGVDLKIRKTDLQSLTKFLRRVETGPNLIYFDQMHIRTRYGEHDALEVEVGVVTFERAPEAPKGKGDKT